MKITGSRRQGLIFTSIILIIAALWLIGPGRLIPCVTPANYTMQQSAFVTCHDAKSVIIDFVVLAPIGIVCLICLGINQYLHLIHRRK